MSQRGPNHKTKRRSVEYDTDTPRCQTCKQYRKTHHVVNNGRPTGVATIWCQMNKFPVRPAGLCNLWESKRGEKLEAGPTNEAERGE